MDQWQEHVALELSEAYGNDERLLEIAYALVAMDRAQLIPDDISDYLFDRLGYYSE